MKIFCLMVIYAYIETSSIADFFYLTDHFAVELNKLYKIEDLTWTTYMNASNKCPLVTAFNCTCSQKSGDAVLRYFYW